MMACRRHDEGGLRRIKKQQHSRTHVLTHAHTHTHTHYHTLSHTHTLAHTRVGVLTVIVDLKRAWQEAC